MRDGTMWFWVSGKEQAEKGMSVLVRNKEIHSLMPFSKKKWLKI